MTSDPCLDVAFRRSVDGERVAVGGPGLLQELGADVPAVLASRTRGWAERGASLLHVIKGHEVIGAIALEDAPREESRQAVDALHAHGLNVAMITGDAHQSPPRSPLTSGSTRCSRRCFPSTRTPR